MLRIVAAIMNVIWIATMAAVITYEVGVLYRRWRARRSVSGKDGQ